MADTYVSPYALPVATMDTYKPTSDYSSLKGFDPFRNTVSLKKSNVTGFNKATALNPDGSTKAVFTNSAPIDQYGLAKNLAQPITSNYGELLKSFVGSSNGVGTYGTWTDPTTGKDYGLDEAAFNAVQNPYASPDINATVSTLDFSGADQSGLAGLLSGIGGAKGFSDLAGGIGTLGSMYMGYQANKRADKEMDALNQERARMKQKDVDFSKGLAASGLGTYSAGV